MLLLERLLRGLVQAGQLNLYDAEGTLHRFGDGRAPEVTLRLHDRSLHTRLFFNPELAVGEAYMEGTLTIEDGQFSDLFALYLANIRDRSDHWLSRTLDIAQRVVRGVQQHNPLGRAQRNVVHHYDLSDDLYDLFLDADRQYSCAYFEYPNQDLDSAQLAKNRHLAAKLCLEPGQRVLDIGSGWGGLALYLAEFCDVDVTGVTLSKEQHAVSNQRAQAQGLSDRVRFELLDYRKVEGSFDRIVSVGMLEHVGVFSLREYFAKIRELLTPRGVAVIHSIGNFRPVPVTSPWIRKYIFPGGYTPSLSEIMHAVEPQHLWVGDIEILRLHYADTLKEWHRRFQSNRARASELYDERFCRMWEFYLLAAEAAFRDGDKMVFQLQLAKERDAMPLTRNYIGAAEERLRELERRRYGDASSTAAA